VSYGITNDNKKAVMRRTDGTRNEFGSTNFDFAVSYFLEKSGE